MWVVSSILQKFCDESKLKINIAKSKVFASKGVTQRRKEKITNISHIRFTNNLGKYLGLQMAQAWKGYYDSVQWYFGKGLVLVDIFERKTVKLARKGDLGEPSVGLDPNIYDVSSMAPLESL